MLLPSRLFRRFRRWGEGSDLVLRYDTVIFEMEYFDGRGYLSFALKKFDLALSSIYLPDDVLLYTG